jgi:putative transcriptional regulator
MVLDIPYLIGCTLKMSVSEPMKRGSTEAADYRQGNIRARKTKPTIKPVDTFSRSEIKRIRQQTGLSQAMFAGSLGVSPKTVEAWESGRNKPEGASRRLLEIVRDDPGFLRRFQAGGY